MSKYRIKRVTEKNTLGEVVSDNFIIEKKVLWWWTNSTATTLYFDNIACFYDNTLLFSKLEDAQNFKEYLESKKSFSYKGKYFDKYLDVNSWRLGHGIKYLYLLNSSIKYSHPSLSTFDAVITDSIKKMENHIDKTTIKTTVNYNVELEAEAEKYNL